jgi:anaerobic magnesium-protoporphyrin IX monomethyl ester cyclase
MELKILITHSYFYRFDKKQWKAHRPYPPLGTLYAASLLRKNGFEISFFDTCLAKEPAEILPVIYKFKPSLLVIYDDGFNYLTKMCLTNMREAAFELIRIGKDRGMKVVVSSSDSTDHFDEYLHKGADFVILGEGEMTLLELVSGLNNPSFDPHKITGMAFLENQAPIKNDRRLVIEKLDELPFPAWDMADLDKYRTIWNKYHGYFSLNIATTRGCPYHCNWCAKPIYGHCYNSRSPENVVQEITMLIKNYQVSHFWICDDIFGLKPLWIERFRKLVEENGLKFSYTIQSRADLVVRENIAEDLAASGAEIVWLGAESGSQKILDAMEKGQTVNQIYMARNKLAASGIKTGFFLQFGYPGEEIEDIQKTIGMLMTLMPEDIGISISYPLPGTKFYEKVKEELRKKANWSDSDDLALMYNGTYSPDFYRRLHRYVHHIFRRKQRMKLILSVLRGRTKPNPAILRDVIAFIYYFPAIMFDRIMMKQ